MVKKRGLDLSIGLRELEEWDKSGIFHPIIRYRYPTTIHRKLHEGPWGWETEPFLGEVPAGEENDFTQVVDNGWRPEYINRSDASYTEAASIQVPDTKNYVSWKDYEWQDKYGRTDLGGVYYHPFQIFRFNAVIQATKLNWIFPSFKVGGKIRKFIQEDFNYDRKNLAQCELYHLKTLYLLGLIEDRYLPKWRGARHQVRLISSARGEFRNAWYEWANNFDASATLNACELSLEEIKKMREDLAWRGHSSDPNHSFYLLLRHFSYERRQKLEGNALLAWDYYEAAEIIGWFLADATGEEQAATDDLTHSSGDWKKRFYGIDANKIDFDQGNILRRLLLDYSLDPVYKLLFIVEGESEAEFITSWCEIAGLDLELIGVRLLILEGLPGLNSKTTHQAVEQAKKDKAGIILVVDDDNMNTSAKVDEWVEKGLLDRRLEVSDLERPNRLLGGLVWAPCFEEVNFTLDQLLNAWMQLIDEYHAEKGSDRLITKEEILVHVENIRTNPPDIKGRPQGCNSWISAMLVVQRRLHLPLTKPALAKHLARLYWKENIPITQLIHKCCEIATLATNYGPPRPDGGFGYGLGEK